MLLAVISVLTVLAFAIGLSACTGSDSDAIDEARTDAALATEAGQRAQVLAALEPLNPLRYHHPTANPSAIGEHQIPADAVIWATRLERCSPGSIGPPRNSTASVEPIRGMAPDSLAARISAGGGRCESGRSAEPSKITHALAHTFESTLEAC